MTRQLFTNTFFFFNLLLNLLIALVISYEFLDNNFYTIYRIGIKKVASEKWIKESIFGKLGSF